MKLWTYISIGLLAICTAEEHKDTKDKRQISQHQTRRSPIPRIAPQIETLYGTHPGQFLIRAIGPQHSQQQAQHHQSRIQPAETQPEPEQTQEEQFAYIPENIAAQYTKPPPKRIYAGQQHKPQGVQYIQQQQQELSQHGQNQQIQLISEDQLLKLLEEELGSKAQLERKSPQTPGGGAGGGQGASGHGHQHQGLQHFRDIQAAENAKQIVRVPQNQYEQFVSISPFDYHRSIPNHPLAESSLEKELEKLIASNRPQLHQQYQQEQQQQPSYKAPKLQPKSYATTPSPVTHHQYSFLPDFSQFTAIRPQATAQLQSDYTQRTKQYSQPQRAEQEQKYSKPDPNNGQYFKEIDAETRPKPSQSNYQKKTHYYSAEQKNQAQTAPNRFPLSDSAMKVIEAPALEYERPQVSGLSPALQSYYKNQRQEKPQQSDFQPKEQSRSSIFVSQGTGVGVKPNQPEPLAHAFSNEKVVKLPPQDGRPISQQEFQELVDAGYSVTAIPVPVPVPYDEYVANQKATEEAPKALRHHQPRPTHDRQRVTYLHPLRSQEDSRPGGKGQSS